jgi:putative transposase
MVERTLSWFGRNRQLAKDFDNHAATLACFVTLASIQLALRRLARAQGAVRVAPRRAGIRNPSRQRTLGP